MREFVLLIGDNEKPLKRRFNKIFFQSIENFYI